MALVTKEFKLDLAPGQLRPVVNASQGDIGRPFKADLYWNGEPWTATGYTAKLRGKKADNTVFEYTATVSGSSVTFSTTEQMTIISGMVECELVFSQGGDVIASANFVLMVEDSPYNPDAPSESVVPGIEDLIEQTIGGDVSDEVDAWLDAHPEVTTTVQDGSITKAKINTAFLPEIENAYVTPEQFGAVGDGTTDDTTALQDAINYGFDNNINKVVISSTYKITSPLKIPYRRTPNFWYGYGITLQGVSRNDSKIVKDGTTTEGGIDTVLYCYNASDNNTQTGSGVIVHNVSIVNNSSSTSAYAIWGNYCRSTFTGLNIKSYKGIYSPSGFCNKYEDIVFTVHEKAIETSGQCTGGVYTRLYAPQAENPYIINGEYSNINLIYGDNCTGVFLSVLSSIGINIGTIGTESPALDCVVEIKYNNINAENTGVTIRQIDMENLTTNDACILKISKGDVRLDLLNISYNHTVADVYLLDFNNKSYGSATIGAVNHVSNATTYSAAKFHQVKNAVSGNTWTRSGKTLHTTFRYDGAQFLGQALQSVHTQEPDKNSNKTIMMNVTKTATGWKQSETEEGVTYRPAPDNGGMVIMDYSKAEFGATTAFPVFDTTGTSQTFEYYRYALGLMAIFRGGAPSAWSNFTPKEGILWVDTTNHKLYIYLGGAWKTISIS